MSGEPVEAAEDTSGVEVGVKVGEEVADVRVGCEATDGADLHVGGEADKWPRVDEGTEDTAGQT